ALFCEALSGDDRYQPLRHKRAQTTAEPAVEFLWTMVDDLIKKSAGSTEEARRREADLIARRIRLMLDRQEPLVAEKSATTATNGDGQSLEIARAVEQKDIAILFRALSDVQHYEEALRQYQIEYYLVGGHAFYAQQEIYDITNLLRTLASPADGISLVGVLRSPMFALTDDTLFWLAQHPQGLAHGLFNIPLAAEITGEQRQCAERAAEVLTQLKTQKDRLPIAGLLNEALRLTGYDAVLLGEFMGERKLANLRKLIDQARQFDRSGGLGLDDFIVQLSNFIVEQPREPLAATHPEGTDVVRLMTIHQAKGLEFPVVFLPDINRNTKSDGRTAVWDDMLGPLVKASDRSEKKKRMNGLDLLKTVSDLEEQAERLRLFYVAATRAKDYLAISSSLFPGEIDSSTAPWTQLLSERFNLQTGEFIATLPNEPNYFPPAVKVTTTLEGIMGAADTSSGRHNLEKLLARAVVNAHTEVKNRRSDLEPVKPAVELTIDTLAGPIGVDHAARRRFSVSRLSGQLEQTGDPFIADATDSQTVQAPASNAVEFGILVHQLLARADFEKSFDRAAAFKRIVESQPARVSRHAETAAALVEQFANSVRGKELAKAKRVERELEFLLAWPPNTAVETTKTPTKKADLYLQGFIDCLYEDAAGRWHLLDYKTNQVT
ncbi:MAG TPA: 3'-5' exonuclease, partial [Pirellulales bacterium]